MSVEVDISKTMMSINEVESTTTFVTMKEDAVKDIIRIDTTEVPSTPMTVTLDEVLLVLRSKRPIEDTAQYTEHSPKISKTIDDCVDSTFMVPAAKETSAPSQAEERTAKSDTIDRKCTTQMKATVTEEKMPTTKRKKKRPKIQTYFGVMRMDPWHMHFFLMATMGIKMRHTTECRLSGVTIQIALACRKVNFTI